MLNAHNRCVVIFLQSPKNPGFRPLESADVKDVHAMLTKVLTNLWSCMFMYVFTLYAQGLFTVLNIHMLLRTLILSSPSLPLI